MTAGAAPAVIAASAVDLVLLSQVIAEAFHSLPPSQWLTPDPAARGTAWPGRPAQAPASGQCLPARDWRAPARTQQRVTVAAGLQSAVRSPATTTPAAVLPPARPSGPRAPAGRRRPGRIPAVGVCCATTADWRYLGKVR